MNSDKDLAKLIEEEAKAIVGPNNVDYYSERSGSEDVTILMDRVQKHGGKAAHFYYGADHNGQHRADFDPDDKQNMPIGFSALIVRNQRLFFTH